VLLGVYTIDGLDSQGCPHFSMQAAFTPLPKKLCEPVDIAEKRVETLGQENRPPNLYHSAPGGMSNV
jgi:hypothetical protein